MSKTFDTVVVGAGVFGAWTAWHLLRAGQRVLMVDKYGPASARASSGGETRVIRMAYGPDEIYTRMSQQSLLDWKGLFARITNPGLFRNTGVLWLAAAGDASAAKSAAVLARNCIRHQVLDHDDLARRYPQIVIPPGGWAIFEPDSGALLARRAVQAVVEDNLRAGAELCLAAVSAPVGDTHLAEISTDAGETIRADRFVFACGPWLGTVLPDVLGGRIFPTRQEVFYFGSAPGDHRFSSPTLPIWLDFGRDYYGFPDIDGRGFKLAHDAHGEAFDPDTLKRLPSPERIAHAREFLGRRFPALAAAPLLRAEVCQYENTWNGDFVIDRHPAFDNVWIAGGGSGHGFKHGPAVGAYLVERMLKDAPAEPRFSLATKQDVQKREVH
ncbi:monomeric sarcosine oxidase [Lysobacter niastensis]|uniref:Monomeric sarcosine oxidase n=1 Tax=Lysobacter niastensis TaxID=380629 RepID=A0ABU1WDH1_9GAMM|nr:FAD-dependent oxidoreductase [Lysobacter niastensis]MDR7135392.1 monomeric sarcosine oxidase [Lysobacter niastensis]